jgi:hypothetical protein
MSALPIGDMAKTQYARKRAEGRCVNCGRTIGVPPQPVYCDPCVDKANTHRRRWARKTSGFDRPIEDPTFERFEQEERRRGRS